MKLYDTLTRSELPIEAEDGKTFRFYCCGPTVYGPAHIGNFRTFLVQDLFRRVAELSGLTTKHVRNLTDVDDKTIRESQVEGKTLKEFTEHWTKKFHQDCEALNLLTPHVEPNAVSHIQEQIEMIESLMEKEIAYQGKDGSIYFSVGAYEAYGKLSHLEERELKLGSAESRNNADEYEKDQLADFALWKAYREEDGENAWDSPWGKGRPGWHIECSAMCKKYLGDSFDLHGGGEDLIFPHHENEIAQSEGANGESFARHWFHASHLLVDGAKMSKSKGNLFTLSDIEKKGYHANELRYALLMGYYRQQLNFTLESLHTARQRLTYFSKIASRLLVLSKQDKYPTYKALLKDKEEIHPLFQKSWEALLDDLNTPEALGQFSIALKEIEKLLNREKVSTEEAWEYGKGMMRIVEAFGWGLPEDVSKEEKKNIPESVQALAQERWQAKKEKNWEKADQLRNQLAEQGWKIKDTPEGFEVLPL